MIMSQVVWCCRQNSSVIYTFVSVAGFCSLASIGVGIYVAISWRNKKHCYSLALIAWGDLEDHPRDYCREAIWASIAAVCGVLWAVVACCMFWFVKSGRHAGWEEKHGGTVAAPSGVVVELGSASEPPQAMAMTMAMSMTMTTTEGDPPSSPRRFWNPSPEMV
jgi:hypothetical protein